MGLKIKAATETLEVEDANITGSRFKNVAMGDTEFHDVGFKGATFRQISFDDSTLHHVDFVNCDLDDVELTGATFRHVRLPKATASLGAVAQQDTVSFRDCNLKGARITDSNLTNVEIVGCNLSGLRINGVLVEELIRKATRNTA